MKTKTKRTKEDEERITHTIGITIEYNISDKKRKKEALEKTIQMYEGGLDIDIIQDYIEKHYVDKNKRSTDFKHLKS